MDTDETLRETWATCIAVLFRLKDRIQAIHAEFGLTPVQGQVLHALENGAARPMTELAGTLGCDASNVTGLVDRLENRGLLERRPAEHDRRVKLLALTPEGEKLRAALLQRLYEPPEALKQLSSEDHKVLLEVLRRALEIPKNAAA